MKSYFVKTTLGFALLFLVGYCLVSYLVTNSLSIFNAFTTSISTGTAFGWLYVKRLWRVNPLEETPRLFRCYQCTIEYSHERGNGRKITKVEIDQTLFRIRLSFSTDEIFSYSTAAQFSEAHGIVFLEYQYCTDPDARFIEGNPKQDGAAKLRVATSGLLLNAESLKGNYWTSSYTRGSISFEPVSAD